MAGEVLDERLARGLERPLAVAVSGGGDSTALALTAARWARAAGRPLLVLSLDHGLNAQSGAWMEACADLAARLGADFRPLSWAGDKPTRGLPAAARAARHRLLAEAACEAGARVILMGHTADDVLEARSMRAAGSTTPEPRAWSPSPAWPEGRGVFLLRPLLGLRRAEVRGWLQAQGERWIEDPANDDPRYARARARLRIEPGDPPMRRETEPNALAALCEMGDAGVLRVSRDALRLARRAQAQAFVGAACLCAAGTLRPASGARLQRLVARLIGHEEVAATLAGARIEADTGTVWFLREPGEAARGGLRPLPIAAGEIAVWDGRFEIMADADLVVRPLAGLARRLSDGARAALRPIRPKARLSLPVCVQAGEARLLDVRPLALDRLQAACGLVPREPL
ncbi:MAG TPA: tRNA lysidine(34) synthetase TilS [Phenylobacterium sp.]|jgi:tRNA(Ile)-lysidine synthase|nr:tRNA lysidine(34) synthetase TilS [Phenylobacterium sp.]